jgi:dUTP pyrophosphatase
MLEPLTVDVRVLPHASDLPLPAYETSGAAGMDLRAAVDDPLELAPGERALCPTGLQIAIPDGYEGQVRPRSGLALRQGLTTLNSPGTIDSDYRGEVKVILANLGDEPIRIERGMRIAQIVFSPVVRAAWRIAASLDATGRGEGGFGHTGVATDVARR